MQVGFSLFSLLFSMLQARFDMLISMLQARFDMLISTLRYAHYMFSLSA